MTVYLGGPIWSNADWIGNFFTDDAQSEQFLQQYASVFNAVEGNNTFYGLPSDETAQRWAASVPATFRFCFKFPRRISHDRGLFHVDADTARFLRWLDIFDHKVGNTFLQLPPTFGPAELDKLWQFLDQLPTDRHWAVDLRHVELHRAPWKELIISNLQERQVNWVCFDTSVLQSIRDPDDSTRVAQQKKPSNPASFVASGQQPMIRFCGHNKVAPNSVRLGDIVEQCSAWLDQELQPYIFIHSPDDKQVPTIARHFYERLQERGSRTLQTCRPIPAIPSHNRCRSFHKETTDRMAGGL